jgi:hypothetical protein
VVVNAPSARPRTISSRAAISAFTVAFGPTVNVEFVKVIFPSTFPSTNKSSVPVTSPFILMPWLTQAGAFGDTVCVLIGLVPALPELVEFVALGETSGDACGFPSSLRHMGTPLMLCFCFEVAFRRLESRRDSESS